MNEKNKKNNKMSENFVYLFEKNFFILLPERKNRWRKSLGCARCHARRRRLAIAINKKMNQNNKKNVIFN